MNTNVTVKIDRPLGTYHPEHCSIFYSVNYGYVEGVIAGDGELQDAYVLGIDELLREFSGVLYAIIHRENDVEDKWVVVPNGADFTKEEIEKLTSFQEQYFDIQIEILKNNN